MTALLLAAALGPPTAVVIDDGPWVPVVDPGYRWAAFLDHLFAHFDRDGDSRLSAAEAARVIPLPLPGGRTVPPLGACDRHGFRNHYRRAGFAPVVARAEPPTLLQRQLAAALFRHLDRDGDGQLSAAEKRAAPDLLRRLDADDDEVLTAAELLPPGFVVGPLPEVASVRVQVAAGRPTGEPMASVHNPTDPAAGARQAGRFLLAQLRGAGGALTRLRLAADPTLNTLADFFDPADRDGDGTLTATELDAFLNLLAEGVACQTVVTVADGGRSVFAACDADGDGRLDRQELATMADRLPGDVPRALVVSVGRGPVAATFGPLRLPAAPPARRATATADVPAWFRAMDRNGDGFLSPAEWVGPPAAFRKLDADGDGRISPAEAAGR